MIVKKSTRPHLGWKSPRSPIRADARVHRRVERRLRICEINGTARNLIRIFVAVVPDRQSPLCSCRESSVYPRDAGRSHSGKEHHGASIMGKIRDIYRCFLSLSLFMLTNKFIPRWTENHFIETLIKVGAALLSILSLWKNMSNVFHRN